MTLMKKDTALLFAACFCALIISGCGHNTNSIGNANNVAAEKKTSASPTTNAAPIQSPAANDAARTATGGEQAKDPAATPDNAANRLYAAWKKNDRAAAALVAAPAAVNKLFKTRGDDPEASAWEFGSCEKSGKGFDCDYYYEGGGAHFIIEGSPEAGYRVASIRFIAD